MLLPMTMFQPMPNMFEPRSTMDPSLSPMENVTKKLETLDVEFAEDGNLKTLMLNKSLLDNNSILPLVLALKSNKIIQDLNLNDNSIGDKGVEELISAMKDNRDRVLTTLILSKNHISLKGLAGLANFLNEDFTLIKLDLGYNRIRNGVLELTTALRENKFLRELNLSGNEIGDEGADALANLILFNSSLRALLTNDNEIGDTGACKLANSLKKNRVLTDLYLVGNKIGNDGAIAFAQALKENKSLVRLSLNSNQFDTLGATHLADVLIQNNSTLTDLFYGGHCINQNVKDAISKGLQKNKLKIAKLFFKEQLSLRDIWQLCCHDNISLEIDIRSNGSRLPPASSFCFTDKFSENVLWILEEAKNRIKRKYLSLIIPLYRSLERKGTADTTRLASAPSSSSSTPIPLNDVFVKKVSSLLSLYDFISYADVFDLPLEVENPVLSLPKS